MSATDALKIIKPLNDIGSGLIEISKGDIYEGYRKIVSAAATSILTAAELQLIAEQKKPNYEKIGLEAAIEFATNSAKAKLGVSKIWSILLKNAIDQENTNFEIRHSDIEIINSLNSSDAILLMASDVFNDSNKQLWAKHELYINASRTMRGRGAFKEFNENINKLVPLKWVIDHAEMKIGSKICMNEDVFIHCLNECKASSKAVIGDIVIYGNFKKYCREHVFQIYSRNDPMREWENIETNIGDNAEIGLCYYCPSAFGKRLLNLLGKF